MLRGGRGFSPKAPSHCENAPVAFTPNQPGLWLALVPGQRWRLSSCTVGTHAVDRRLHLKPWRALPQAAQVLPSSLEGLSSSAQRASLVGESSGAGLSGGNHGGGLTPQLARHQGHTRLSSDADLQQSLEVWPEGSAAVAPPMQRRVQAGSELPPRSRARSGASRATAAGARSHSARTGSRRRAAAPLRKPPPAALSDERVVPLMLEAERDLLPDGNPNTPWRRLGYQLRMASSIGELLYIYRGNRENEAVWRPHMTALTITRAGALLYPKAVAAAAAAAQAEGRTDSAGRFPPRTVKIDATSLFESLSRKLNKLAIRQVQGMHVARVLVSMAWLETMGPKCDELLQALVRELQRQNAGKLAQVAAVEPRLFGRLVRALAQLAPGNRELWVDVQRVTMEALLEAKAAAVVDRAEGGPRRVWAGPSRRGGGAAAAAAATATAATAAPPLPRPDASTADLANMAFGFAAAGAATPELFSALREAVLSRELPADPDALARLMCAWGRSRIPSGQLPYRILEVFRPFLDTAPPRPIGRMIWSLGMMGMRDERFLRAAARAIVGRRLVFSSPQELVNVVWAYSRLGWRVEEGAEPLRPAARKAAGGASHEGENADDEEDKASGDGPSGQHPGTRCGGELRRLRERQGPWGAAESGEGRDEAAEAEPSAAAAVAVAGAGASPDRTMDEHAQASSGLRKSGGGGEVSGSSAAAQEHESVGLPDLQVGPPGARRLQPLKPLPLSAALAAGEQARRALAQPLPDYPERFALFRYLARTFIHREISSTAGGRPLGGSDAHHTISHPQLAVLVGSFARAGYRSKQLLYTTARMALLRMPFLSPADLTLILSAHAALRIPHGGLFEAALPLVEARCREFSAQQLADVLWAVQVLMPHETYVQLANALRVRRGWQAPLPPPPGLHGPDGRYDEEEEEEQAGSHDHGATEEGEEEGTRRGSGVAAARQQWHHRAVSDDGPLVPTMMRLRVPRELLEDSDWLDAEEEGEGEEAARQRDGSVWGPRPGRMGDDDEYWGEGGAGSGAAAGAGLRSPSRSSLVDDLPAELVTWQ